jgi:hypothetical protein
MAYGIALVWAALTGPVVALLLEARHAAWAAMLGYHAGCLLAASSLRAGWGPRPGPAVLLAWTVGSAAIVFGAGSLVVPTMFPPEVLDRARAVLTEWGMSPTRAPWLLTYYVLVNPGLEEWFWRATLLDATGPIRAPGRRAISIVAFVPFHAVVLQAVFGSTGLAWMLVGIAGASAFWASVQVRRGTTWPAYASHMGADAGVALLYFRFLGSG